MCTLRDTFIYIQKRELVLFVLSRARALVTEREGSPQQGPAQHLDLPSLRSWEKMTCVA